MAKNYVWIIESSIPRRNIEFAPEIHTGPFATKKSALDRIKWENTPLTKGLEFRVRKYVPADDK